MTSGNCCHNPAMLEKISIVIIILIIPHSNGWIILDTAKNYGSLLFVLKSVNCIWLMGIMLWYYTLILILHAERELNLPLIHYLHLSSYLSVEIKFCWDKNWSILSLQVSFIIFCIKQQYYCLNSSYAKSCIPVVWSNFQ